MFIKYYISTFDDFPILFILKPIAKFLITIANEKTYFCLHQVYYEHQNQYEHKKYNQKLLNVKTLHFYHSKPPQEV